MINRKHSGFDLVLTTAILLTAGLIATAPVSLADVTGDGSAEVRSFGLQTDRMTPILRTRPAPRTTLCHCPPGNPDNCHTINVGGGAAAAHLTHGDTLGSCDGFSDEIQNILTGLGDRAAELGLELDLDEALVLAGGGATVVAAPSSTLADTPPLDILNGEFLGLSFMSIPGAPFPPGYYRCRAFTPTGGAVLGPQPVQVELVDDDGDVAAVIPGLGLLGSFDLPADPRDATVAGSLAPEVFASVDPDDFVGLPPIGERITISIWWLCDNGSWICITITF